MAKTNIVKQTYSLKPSSQIELFELDTSNLAGNTLPLGQQKLYFHNSKQNNLDNTIHFGDPLISYMAIPILMKNNEIKADSTSLPRPRLSIGNENSLVSYYIRASKGLVGAKLTRTRTFAEYLHEDTWGGTHPFGSHDPDAVLVSDVYYIEKIVDENKLICEFELASILELNGVQLPRQRMYANSCRFKYRNSSGCGYNNIGGHKLDVNAYPVATKGNVRFVEDLGMSLNPRGNWTAGATYNRGDFVKVESSIKTEDGVSHEYEFYYFVAKQTHAATEKTYPPIDKDNWYEEACSKTVQGCALRFQPGYLRIGAFSGLTRTEFDT